MAENTKVLKVNASDILNLLKKGYTRYKKDDIGFGSIQEHYGRSAAAIQKMFKHPDLKNRRTIVPTIEVVGLNEEKPAEKEPTGDLLTDAANLAENAPEIRVLPKEEAPTQKVEEEPQTEKEPEEDVWPD